MGQLKMFLCLVKQKFSLSSLEPHFNSLLLSNCFSDLVQSFNNTYFG